MINKEKNAEAFNRLIEVMQTLREKCPWDSTQTWDSLRPNTIEEIYELLDAIAKQDKPEIKKELGDVLLHVVFYSQIASEENAFDIADVCDAVSDKLIYRHPHIYGNQQGQDDELSWEQLKQKEKGGNKTVLAGVPADLPTLIKAYRIQDKARNVGYTDENIDDLSAEITDGINKAKTEEPKSEALEDLFGSLLFKLTHLARLYHINPEVALEKQNRLFTDKINKIEEDKKKNI